MQTERTRTNRHGFTMVELMIAISVFSLVLVLITTGILRFTRQYYKGVISSKTQDAARAVVDDVTRAIQFNGGSLYDLTTTGGPGPTTGYCLGKEKRYRFYMYSQVTDHVDV